MVTKLNSIEDAASMEILCLDKTGTITENKLSVIDSIPFSGFKKEDVAMIASLASKEGSKDVIDLTVIEYAKAIGRGYNIYKQVSFTPFDPAIKRSEAIIEHEGGRFKVVKGAPQIIISMCSGIDEETRSIADGKIQELSRGGYRTLAVARSNGNDINDLRLVGLLPLADPPRSDSKEMIGELRKLGL